MNFLERLFNFSPDGGDGTMEQLIVIAILFVAACILTSVWLSRRRSQTDAE